MQLYTVYFICKLLYMFGVISPPIIRTTNNCIFISVINQLDAHFFYNKFISCLYMFRAHVLIIRRSKLHYTASVIITLCNVILTS